MLSWLTLLLPLPQPTESTWKQQGISIVWVGWLALRHPTEAQKPPQKLQFEGTQNSVRTLKNFHPFGFPNIGNLFKPLNGAFKTQTEGNYQISRGLFYNPTHIGGWLRYNDGASQPRQRPTKAIWQRWLLAGGGPLHSRFTFQPTLNSLPWWCIGIGRNRIFHASNKWNSWRSNIPNPNCLQSCQLSSN